MAKITMNTDCKEDRYGRCPDAFLTPSTTLKDIWEYLWANYGGDGYKFAVVFDVSHEEYEPCPPLPLFFLDEIEGELKAYMN